MCNWLLLTIIILPCYRTPAIIPPIQQHSCTWFFFPWCHLTHGTHGLLFLCPPPHVYGWLSCHQPGGQWVLVSDWGVLRIPSAGSQNTSSVRTAVKSKLQISGGEDGALTSWTSCKGDQEDRCTQLGYWLRGEVWERVKKERCRELWGKYAGNGMGSKDFS